MKSGATYTAVTPHEVQFNRNIINAKTDLYYEICNDSENEEFEESFSL